MVGNKPVNYKDVKPGDVVIARAKEWISRPSEPSTPLWVFTVIQEEYEREGLGSQLGFWPAASHDFFVVGDGYATITSSATVRIMEVDND